MTEVGTEDLLLMVGVLLASMLCGWYLVQAVDAVLIAPDAVCTTADCLALAAG